MHNIEAWSANEITINWNAPLVWLAAFLDERGPKVTGAVTPSTSANPAGAGVTGAKGEAKGKK